MKRWNLGVFVGLAVGSTACQMATPVESETTQLLTDPCNVPAPPAPVWDGSQPLLATATQLYIMYAPVNGYSFAALVDYKAGSIPYARQVPTGKRNTFIAATQSNYGRIVVGGGPPPPPDVIGPTLVFAAQRYAMVPSEAAADAASCGPVGPIVGPGPIGPGPIKGF